MKRYLRFEFCLLLAIIGCWMAWHQFSTHYTDRGRAWKAVHALSDTIIEFRETQARWPKSLDELESPSLISHDGTAFTYDASKPMISLPKMFPPTWFERTFTHKGGEGNYGMDLASAWKAQPQK